MRYITFISVLAFFLIGFQTISAPNGIRYTVTSTRYTYKADILHCGYNDLSLPNMGRYKVEDLRYEEYKDGKVIRSWNDTRETFVDCYTP
ncbi:MAG: hypothetical protein JNM95_05285 [Chitinophagaceae bacterium]|nr:hypothetical protein [Chitinophagaceae bacterium]